MAESQALAQLNNPTTALNALDKSQQKDIVASMKANDPQTLAEVIEWCKVMALSNLMSVKNASEAVGLVLLGKDHGLSAAQSISGALHVIQGKVGLSAQLVLAKVRQHPDYDYKVVEHSPEAVAIEFYRNGELQGVSRFTMDDAKRQATQNLQKFPENMLHARAAGNGVRWYCPDVVMGNLGFIDGEPMDIEESDVRDLAPGETPKDQLKAELAAGLQQELPPPSTPNGEAVVPAAQDVAPVEGAPAGDSDTPGVPQVGEGQASVSAADPASTATEQPAEAPKDEAVNETPAKSQGAKAPKEEKPAKDGDPAPDPLDAALEPYGFKASQVRMLNVEAAERNLDLATVLAACEDKTWGGALAAVTGRAQG